MDLVTEILLHLPMRSVLRFRSVCKFWCNIIDSSTFRESYLQNQSKNIVNDDDVTLFLQFSKSSMCELSIFNTDSGKLHKGGFPAFQKFLNENIGSGTERLFVVGPVNGLICTYNKIPYVDSEGSWSLSIAIYNPCLDKIKILPVSPFCSSLCYEYWSSGDCIRDVGFGFDYGAKEYKVVQLICFLGGRSSVEVYSGTTNTWRKLVTDATPINGLFMYKIQGIKSCIYAKSGSSAYWRTKRYDLHYAILSFNMQNEVFETISHPDFAGREVDVMRSSEVFVKDVDLFALFVYSYDFCRLEVWKLERRVDESWIHVRDVNVMPFTRGLKLPWPKGLWKKDVVILMEYGYKECNLIFYDYSKDKVRMSCVIPNEDIEILECNCRFVSP